jgi:hypothetical protein
MKMDPAKRAQTQNAGEVSSLQWFFSQSIELMMDKVWLHLGCALTFASEAKISLRLEAKKSLISHDSLRCETPKI